MIGMGYIGLEPGVLYSMSGSTGAEQETETLELAGTGGVVLPENASPAGLLVYGKCEQDTNSGAQLFDRDNPIYVPDLAYYEAGSQFVPKGVDTTVEIRMYYIEASPNTTYTVTQKQGAFMRVITCSDIPAAYVITTNSKATSTGTVTITTGADDAYIVIYPLSVSDIEGGVTYEAAEETMMINVGSAALSWEAYTGGVTLPNPDQPQEIRSVGALTRNLLDEEAAKDYGNWAQYPDTEGSVSTSYMSYRLELRPNTTYTVSRRDAGGLGDNYYVVISKIGTLTSGASWMLNSTGDSYNQREITVLTDDSGLLFVTANVKSQTRLDALWNLLGYLQVEKGTTATDHEPYGYKVSVQTPQQRLDVYMREPLRGVPVTSGGNYTDSDGQQWVCDVLDLGARKVLRRTWATTLDGDEDWKAYESYGGFYCRNLFTQNMMRREGFCNQLGVTKSKSQNSSCWIGVNNSFFYALNVDYYLSDAEDLGLAAWKEHLKEAQMEIVTYLDAETEEDLLPGGAEISIDGGKVIPEIVLQYQEGE